jgi:hypothetical protein
VTDATLRGIFSSADPAGTKPFFVPGAGPAQESSERELRRLRRCAETITGKPPGSRRIQRIDCRVEGTDCVIEVGHPDPVAGDPVVAILELGRHLPYGVFTTADANAPALLVGPSVYTVTEFS